MNEWPRAATWLNTVLGGEPEGGGLGMDPIATVTGVHEHPAPQGVTFPIITFQVEPEEDVTVVGEDRVWAEFRVLVTAIGEGQSTLGLAPIADEIDARLHGAEFGLAGDDAMVVSSVRDRPFSLPILEEGKSYRRLGGYFRLIVQPLST